MPNIGYLGPSPPTEEQLVERLKWESPSIIAIDTETVSLKDRRVIGLGIALNEREAVYFPTWPLPTEHIGLALRLLDGPAVKVFHNTMYELHGLNEFAKYEGLETNGERDYVGPVRVYKDGKPLLADTATMGQVQALPSSRLALMAHAYEVMENKEISDILPSRHNMLDIPEETVAHKCMRDCLATIRLYHRQGGASWWGSDGHTWSYEPNWFEGYNPLEPTSYYVPPHMKECYQVDIHLIPLLMRMSMRGVGLRPQIVGDWYERLSKQKILYEDICSKEYFNPGSPQQVGFILAQRGNILPFTKSRRQLRTDEQTLSRFNDPLITVVLKWREVSKLLSTYLVPWLGQERAWTHFKMEVATGRLASYERNMQNIPQALRNVFAPDTGAWSWADASEIEMRMIAYASQDPTMLRVYKDGGSVHTDTQMTLWPDSDPNNKEHRKPAKTFNFAMTFGGEDEILHEHTRRPIEACREYRKIWGERYPGAIRWISERMEDDKPYTEDIFGRRSRLPKLGESTIGHIKKCKINYVPQSSAASAVKRAMLICDREGFDQALQVHDEILCDGVVEFPLEEMAEVHPGIRTPFKAEVGPNWG